jgi:hypothetical protein
MILLNTHLECLPNVQSESTLDDYGKESCLSENAKDNVHLHASGASGESLSSRKSRQQEQRWSLSCVVSELIW